MLMNKLRELEQQRKKEQFKELILDVLGFILIGGLGYVLTCLVFCL